MEREMYRLFCTAVWSELKNSIRGNINTFVDQYNNCFEVTIINNILFGDEKMVIRYDHAYENIQSGNWRSKEFAVKIIADYKRIVIERTTKIAFF